MSNDNRNRNDNRNQQPKVSAIVKVDGTRYGLPQGPVTDVGLVRDALATALEKGCNLLAPLTQLQTLPPDHEVALVVVAFPLDGEWSNRSNGTWYEVDGGKVSLHRGALDRLAAAAGLSSVPEHCRVELVETFFWRATYTVRGKGFDGQERTVTKSVEFDVRQDSPEARKLGRGLAGARKFGARHAESKAANRAIRSFLGLNGSYTRAAAAKPFVFPKLQWVPDMSDPMIRRMVAAKQLGIVDQLFGAQARAENAPQIVQVEEEAIPEGGTAPADPAPTLVPPRQGTDDPPWAGDRWEQENDGSGEVPDCSVCGKPLTNRVANYSADKYGEPLCYQHQPRGGDQ